MNAIHLETNYKYMVNSTISKSFNINHLHNVFGQCAFETLKSAVIIQNLTMLGNSQVCENFDIVKGKAKDLQ
jgi:hypothetical protein